MASFKCNNCGRTDFFTSHGFAKHGRKCARTVSSSGSKAGIRPFSVPAWEKVKGAEYDASKLSPGTSIVRSGPWTVYAYASDYNSRQRKGVSHPYVALGSGPLTGRDLVKHANKVVDHADKQGATRFFEFFKVSKAPDGSTLIVMIFGS